MLDEPKFERYHVPILVKALRIMEFLAEHPNRSATATEVSDELKIPKNSAFRILTTLTDYGYIARDEEEKTYRLRHKLLNLGYAAIDETSLVENAIDIMRELRDEIGESVFLAARTDFQGVIIEQVQGLHPVKVVLELGHRFPMHTSAPGKAMLANLSEAECEAAIQSLDYTKYNDRTITSPDDMRRELATVLERGYALDLGEELDGLHCIGAPILNHRQKPIAAIWVSAVASALPESDTEHLGISVRNAAARISARFGCTTFPEYTKTV